MTKWSERSATVRLSGNSGIDNISAIYLFCDVKKPPNGFDKCEQAKWEYYDNRLCVQLRTNWDKRWNPGRHEISINEGQAAIKNRAEEIELNRAVDKTKPIFQVTSNLVTNWCVIIFKKGTPSDYRITITDLSGRILFSKPGNKQLQTTSIQLDFNNYAKGIYFISLYSSIYIKTVKIVKE